MNHGQRPGKQCRRRGAEDVWDVNVESKTRKIYGKTKRMVREKVR